MARDVNIRINGDPSSFEQAVIRAKARATEMQRVQDKVDREYRAMATAHGAALREEAAREKALADATAAAQARRADAHKAAGQAILAGSTAVAAGLALSAKQAMSWQSAFAGVRKTVDGTPEDLAEIEKGLRDLARELPATHTEIAGVAEAAGQLGVAKGDVVAFSKVMLDLGETTNLSAQEAATALARLQNIMGTAAADTERMGSTIVALGNNSATTEAEIVELATRLAAAGRQAGLSEADVFAFASTLTSVGVEAEAGGTAMSKVFTSINDAVADGNKNLDEFARVSGVSVEEFSRRFREDGAGAIALFVDGLGRMAQRGESTTAVFKELGLTDERLKRALLSTGQAQGLLTSQLGLANTAWQENNALAIEAAQRYETAESKIAMAKNSINDVAIELGGTFLPMIADAAEGVADFAGWVADLPQPLVQAAAGLAGIASAAGLVTGAVLLGLPKLLAFRTQMVALRTESPKLASGLTKAGKAAGIAVAALAGIQLVGAGIDAAFPKAAKGAEELAANLRALATDGAAVRDLFGDLENAPILGTQGEWDFKDFGDLEAALGRLDEFDSAIGGAQRKVAEFLTLWDNTQSGQLEGRLGEISRLLGTLATNDLPSAVAQFTGLYNAAGATDEAGQRLLARMPELRDELIGIADKGGLATDEATLLALALGKVVPKADATAIAAENLAKQQEVQAAASKEAEEALAKWREEMTDAASESVSLLGAHESVVEAEKARAEATAEATSSSKDSWEDYYDGVTVSADQWIQSLRDQVTAQESWADNISSLSERVNTTMSGEMRDAANAMIDELVKAGPESASAVQTLVGMSDKQLRELVKLGYVRGDEVSAALVEAIERHRDPEVTIDVDTAAATTALDRWVTQANGRRVRIVVGAEGTRLPSNSGYQQAYASGGRVPGTPPANPWVDNVAATDGRRAYKIRSGEWIVNGIQSEKQNRLLGRMNAGFDAQSLIDQIEGYASGGRVGWSQRDAAKSKKSVKRDRSDVRSAERALRSAEKTSEKKIEAAQKAYNAIDGTKANRTAKKAAKAHLDATKKAQRKAVAAAKAALAAAKKELAASEKELAADRARTSRLSEDTRDLKTEVRRGDIRDQVSSGIDGAYGVVDRLSEQSRNADLSTKQRKNLATVARDSEKKLKDLYGKLEDAKKQIAAAEEKAAELQQISDQVSSGLRGEQSLANSLGQDAYGYDKKVTAKTLVADAQARAGKIRAFAGKLKALADRGLAGTILQEIAGLGSEEGGRVADALLSGSQTDLNSLNSAYADIEKWSNNAGQYVTEGFYDGGLQAANGLVKGLQDKQADIEAEITKVAIGMEKALKKALGIASPSKVTTKIGEYTGEGLVIGQERTLGDVEEASRRLADAATPNVAPTHNAVPAYSPHAAYARPAGAGPETFAAAVASAVERALTGATVELAGTLAVDRPTSLNVARVGLQEWARVDQAAVLSTIGVP